MPSDRWDFWNDSAEADAVLHGSDLWDDDDRPSRADLADDVVPTRVGPSRGAPFHEAVEARKAAEKDGAA